MLSLSKTIRLGGFIAAAALVAYGLSLPVDRGGDTRWLLCLWGAAPLMLLGIWLGDGRPVPGIAGSLRNLAIVVGVGFGLLSLQLLREQVVQANAIASKVEINESTGEVTSNVRQVLQSMRVRRGRIFDRNDELLVDSEVREGGFVHRIYPLAQSYDPAAFSNIVGFYSTRFGLAGIESTYDDYLSGVKGGKPVERLLNGLYGRPRVGNDLRLTLDARLQAEVARLMAGRTGSAVVLDPKTGAVRAMVSVPGYDPQHLSFDPGAENWNAENDAISAYWRDITADNAGEPLLNRPAQGLYPPGSTFKTVTAVGVLENPSAGRPDDIRCLQTYDAGYPAAPPVVNAVDALYTLTGDPANLERVYAFSCNTAFAQYAVRLGEEQFSAVAKKFGVYRPEEAADQTPAFSDLPSAISRLFVDSGFLENPRALADTGYGQGELLVSPLQMAMIAAAVANNGVMMRPYIVDHITAQDGTVVSQHGPEALGQAMSFQTAATMRKNMQAGVVYGFGKPAQIPGVNVGGKSGTAENKPGAVPHAWFIAIAPVESPRYAVAVMIENGGEGSSVGAKLAGEVMAAALRSEGGQ